MIRDLGHIPPADLWALVNARRISLGLQDYDLAGGGRRYIGCEIDPARHATALANIERLCAKEGE